MELLEVPLSLFDIEMLLRDEIISQIRTVNVFCNERNQNSLFK